MNNSLRPLAIICFLLCSILTKAQTRLLLEKQGDVVYVNYVVQTGETLSGISKQFGSDIGTVMRFNGMNANSKLVVGETVKVPVKLQLLKQTDDAASLNTALVHVVGRKETLYRISVNHNKVPVELLKKWNNFTDNAISEGQQIIVGYLNTSAVNAPGQSPLATANQAAPAVTAEQPTTNNNSTDFQIQKPTGATPSSIVTEAANKESEEASTKPAVKRETSEKLRNLEASIDPSRVKESGFFTALYGVDVKGRSSETMAGTAMTFKSSSGWSDKKYYILMNNASPGSIVKVSTGGSKFIYAKVLWSLGELKENQGLDFRLSNAAAAALGITDAKFPLQVTYFD